MTTIFKLIKTIILVLLPPTYMLYILYIRLFLVRDTRILFTKLSYIQIVFILFILIGLLLQIYTLLKREGVIKENPKKSKLSLWLQTKASALLGKFTQMWIDFYRFFVIRSQKMHNMLVALAKLLYKVDNIPLVLFIIFVFEILPKVVILVAFLIDIFWFHAFYYFYKTLVLLLIPLIYSTLFSMLQQFYEDNNAFFEEFITLKPVMDPEGTGMFQVKYDFVDGYTPPPFVENIDHFLDYYYHPIKSLARSIKIFKGTKLYYRINRIFVLMLMLHVVGWVTILVFGVCIK